MDKFMHKRAMVGLLPVSVLNRQTKAEFSVTFDKHLREMEADLIDVIPARNHRWLQGKEIRSFYESYVNRGATDWPAWMLWNLFGWDAVSMVK